MGKTYRHQREQYDDQPKGKKSKGKHSGHANNRKTGGMRIISLDDTEVEGYGDFFEDEVNIQDTITINKTSGTSR